jgi:ATPase subunit of ABC transporter with duplicated ATPase domains
LNYFGSHAKALIALDDAAIATPDGRPLFRTGKLWIERDDRVVLLGPNGAGKSRMVAAVLAAVGGQAGAIRPAASLVAGYCDQHLAQVPETAVPFDLVSRLSPSDAVTRSQLAGAGIGTDWQGRKVALLSGGQKARLALLLLRLQRPNFYLLDEPTNHLDIDGQEVLEGELLAEGATCLLVSHDRHFVRAVGNRFWEIQGKRLVEVDSPEPFFTAMWRTA